MFKKIVDKLKFFFSRAKGKTAKQLLEEGMKVTESNFFGSDITATSFAMFHRICELEKKLAELEKKLP